MAPRSKPYTITHPLTPDQVENIDEMFDILFADIRNGSLFPFEEEGDLLYYDGVDNERLPIGDANTVLRTDGDTPEWGKVQLDGDVENTLPVGNGGTGVATLDAYRLLAGGTAVDNPIQQVSGVGTLGQHLASQGSGALPVWTDPAYFGNLIINGGFRFSARTGQATATISDTAARTYGFDRWAITNQNASVSQTLNQTHITPETGLTARHYAGYQKITNTGKIVVSQAVESQTFLHTRGQTVRLQLKLKASSAKTMRVVLLQLTSSGTVDVIPGYASGAPSGTFISAFGANSTDPTFGTNLSKITPSTADNSTIANDGLTCSVTTAWQRFGGTFVVPSDCLNLMVVVFTDSQFTATTDTFYLSEVDLHLGTHYQLWQEPNYSFEHLTCQRYYTKSFGLAVLPAQNAGLSTAVIGTVSVAGASAGQPIVTRYAALMRVAPTLTFYNPSNADAFVRNTTRSTNATATAGANGNATGTDITFTGIAAWTVGDIVRVHYSGEAEI
jgi:hypothetical protein